MPPLARPKCQFNRVSCRLMRLPLRAAANSRHLCLVNRAIPPGNQPKTPNNPMKANLLRRAGLLMLLAVAATLSSCKKNTEVEPQGDLSDRIAGQYTFSSLTLGGKVYPAAESNIKGGVAVTRATASSVDMNFNITLKSNGAEFITGLAEDVELTDLGGGQVQLRASGETQPLGKGGNNKLELNSVDEDGTPFTLTLTK